MVTALNTASLHHFSSFQPVLSLSRASLTTCLWEDSMQIFTKLGSCKYLAFSSLFSVIALIWVISTSWLLLFFSFANHTAYQFSAVFRTHLTSWKVSTKWIFANHILQPWGSIMWGFFFFSLAVGREVHFSFQIGISLLPFSAVKY